MVHAPPSGGATYTPERGENGTHAATSGPYGRKALQLLSRRDLGDAVGCRPGSAACAWQQRRRIERTVHQRAQPKHGKLHRSSESSRCCPAFAGSGANWKNKESERSELVLAVAKLSISARRATAGTGTAPRYAAPKPVARRAGLRSAAIVSPQRAERQAAEIKTPTANGGETEMLVTSLHQR